MSYIQPTEADRESTKAIINAYFEPGIGDSLEKATKAFIRIRADAVKSERERIKANIVEARRLAGIPTKDSSDYRWGNDQGLEYVINYILSDDQEAIGNNEGDVCPDCGAVTDSEGQSAHKPDCATLKRY